MNVGEKNKVVMADLGFFLDTSHCFYEKYCCCGHWNFLLFQWFFLK
ncbi:hypothetical protein CQA85_04540 [Streptococcus salivarius]|nr:hypothetical protein CQA85_04540 [Streptococcus salivarius]